MDSQHQTISDVNFTSRSIPSPQLPKPFFQSSVASLHGSSASHRDYVPVRMNPRKLSLHRLLLPAVSLLWLVPIATLLTLNYTKYVIGASVWCPLGRCSADPLMDDAIEKAKQLNKADHNTLGALLLMAKFLEAWFMLIATSIVFDVAMTFATKGNGLPVGYFLAHLQIGDIRSLFNPLWWTSSIPSSNIHSPKQPGRIKRFKLFALAVLVVAFTVLTNLMGPATAVLILPTLQWVDTQHSPERKFEETGAARPPGLSGFPMGPTFCGEGDFSAHNYSCTSHSYQPALLGWAASAVAMAVEENWVGVTSQEKSLNLVLNASSPTDLFWVPNRQAVTALSDDLDQISDLSQQSGSESMGIKGFNNSLQTTLNRQGPVIGMQTACFVGNLTNIEIAKDKHAVCYSGWTFGFEGFLGDDSVDKYQKCFPWGQNWDIANRRSRFSIEAETFKNTNRSTEVTVAISNYFFEKAIYWNDTEDFGSGLLDCRHLDPSLKSCDWERIFTTPMPEPFRNTSMNVGLMEYEFSLKRTNESRIWCDTLAYLGFATYSVDTSPVSNPLYLVTMQEIALADPGRTPLVIDPNWLLAAWSADQDKAVSGNSLPAQLITSAALEFDAKYSASEEISIRQMSFWLFHLYSTSQVMSIINYNWTDPGNVTAGFEDASHPIFRSWATRHVWAYGFSSRTATLGAVVVYAGAFCVLLRIPLSIFGGLHRFNVIELLASALEYVPRGEFLTHQDTKSMAKVRFQLREDDDRKPSFYPNEGRTATFLTKSDEFDY